MAPRYSSSEAINAIRPNDDNVSIRAFVDAVVGPKIVGAQNLNLFKFTVNNGAGKIIQCLAWQENIDRIVDLVKMNKILLIEGAKAGTMKNPNFNLGNVPFELTVNKFTEITVEGTRERETRGNAAAPITRATWEDIANLEGEKIEIVGWIKSNFRQVAHTNNQSSYGAGSITNGEHKLEIRITSTADLPEGLMRGMSISVIGTVAYTTYLHLRVESGEDITVTDEEPYPEPEELINITGPPPKRQRVE